MHVPYNSRAVFLHEIQNTGRDFKFSTMKLDRSMSLTMTTFKMSSTLGMEVNV